MAAKKKRVDPIKQREKRAKIAAIIGGVLLVGVGAFEVPSVLSMMHQKPPPGADATDAGNRNPDGSISLPNVASPTATTANGELADSDVPPTTAADGRLVSFDVFQTKNPFAPQVKSTTSSSTSGAATSGTGDPYGPPATTPTDTTPAAPATPTSPKTPTTTTPAPAVPPAGSSTPPTDTTPASAPPASTTPTSTTPTSTTPVSATVAISVNGTVSHVAVDDAFPSSSPVFRLVSFAKGTAQIGIVGGSYESGDQTLTLQQGKPLTLENQTSGTRYKIELIATP